MIISLGIVGCDESENKDVKNLKPQLRLDACVAGCEEVNFHSPCDVEILTVEERKLPVTSNPVKFVQL